MAKKNIKDILQKVDTGDHTPEEEQAAKLWLFQLNQNKQLNLSDEKLGEVSDKMWSVIEESQQAKPEKYKSAHLWLRIAIAAAIAAIIFSAGLFYYNVNINKEQLNQTTYKNDIAPGKTGATLTLANGRKIRLSDAVNGELAKEAGITVSKTANGQIIYTLSTANREMSGTDREAQINTLTTAKGETYQVRLPDGSLVYLNAASSLTYAASSIERGKRIVKLRGEGYFEIAKDKTHPFIVQSNGQQLEVLGTHFNVNAYPGEANETTLLEGSIKVSNSSDSKLMKPGERSIASDKGHIIVGAADTELAVAWKNNEFMFHEQNIENIMKIVERWYNVEVIYSMDKPTDTYTGSVSRFDNVSKVLQILEQSGAAHFKIEGRKIYVSK